MHRFARGTNPKAIGYEERFTRREKKDRRGGPHIQSGTATVPVNRWSNTIDTYVRALLVAANREGKSDLLFAVGFPEVIDKFDAIHRINDQRQKGFHVERIYSKAKSVAEESGVTLMVVVTADLPKRSNSKNPHCVVLDAELLVYLVATGYTHGMSVGPCQVR